MDKKESFKKELDKFKKDIEDRIDKEIKTYWGRLKKAKFDFIKSCPVDHDSHT